MIEIQSEFKTRLRKQSREQIYRVRSIRNAYRTYLTANRKSNEERVFAILHLNYYLSQTKDSNRVKSALKTYFRRVDNDAFSKSSKKRLRRYVVIENLKKEKYQIRRDSSKYSDRTHVQLEIELPKHLNKYQLRQILKQNLDNQIVKLQHIAVADEDTELVDYNCKDFADIKINQTEEIFDEVNTYFV